MSAGFIRRPVATILISVGIALAGLFAYDKLPVAPLPKVDYPTISVRAAIPGASPDTMATSVASPLERHLGQIADVTEMTSSSAIGSTRITLQFNLNRDIDSAARDVQAAINASRADLPSSLRSNPTYRKVNPADAPVLIIALTSPTLTQGQLYDAASTVLAQRLSQMPGIGEASVSGSALPAVRVDLNPAALSHYGIGLEDVRAALSSANANSPKGAIEDGPTRYQIYTNDQASRAEDYRPLIIAWRNGAPVRLSDVAEIEDSVEDLRNAGLANGKPAVLVVISRQPGANIIETVDGVKEILPQLMAAMPADVDASLVNDRSTTIRASLTDTKQSLVLSIGLVILVVFAFLRSARAAFIPSIAVPVSIVGTFAGMYMLGYGIDNLSLMALTIATGFVVDDAIVVLENISRHIERGLRPMQAALLGAQEVGFTVIAISISLIAVFVPILLMGGILGRLFREFAVTLSIAVGISLFISLTVTPMLCAKLLTREHAERSQHGWLSRVMDWVSARYQSSLAVALSHRLLVLLALFATIGLNVYLYVIIPKGFFPQQDTGRLVGGIWGDQSISFQLMKQKFARFQEIVQADPAVESIAGFTGGRQTNSGFVFVSLKPLSERGIGADAVIARLRPKLAQVAGGGLFLQSVQDLRVGGRQSNSQYQYALRADTSNELYEWTPRLVAAMQKMPEFVDIDSDVQQKGLQTNLVIDRTAAARLGVTPGAIDNTLYDAFGQRQVSTIYSAANQYHVVMGVAPRFAQSPEVLRDLWVSTSTSTPSGTASTGTVSGTFTVAGANGSPATPSSASDAARNLSVNSISALGRSGSSSGSAVSTRASTMVPLAAIAHYEMGNTPLSVSHEAGFVATTISFNLAPGVSLSQASSAIRIAMGEVRMPATIHGAFAGTASTYEGTVSTQVLLIIAAIVAVYLVLGILYESLIHPLTILSTLPSAGVGAVLALHVSKTEFGVIAMIGVILLIGIVKKNAIMMVDFALQAQRRGLSARDAIFEACVLRFRPIIMTTCAAMLGAVPLAFGMGEGAELRHPLGISILGGLLVSQILTLYTTPVVYLYLDGFGREAAAIWQRVTRRRAGDTSLGAS